MKNFYILDGSWYLYRAYYALPDMINSEWRNVNAIYWFIRMVMKLFQDKPDYFTIAWDSPSKTIRHEKFEQYKANRPKIPDDFKDQINLTKILINELWISFVEQPWYEADDIIATLVNSHKWSGSNIRIVSADKDLKQLLQDNVVFFDPLKNLVIDQFSFEKEAGYKPINIVDYLSILWDASDNVPWVKWVWKKWADDLIRKYGDLDSIYANIDQIVWSIKQKLIDSKDLAYQSKELIKLYDVPWVADLSMDKFHTNLDCNKFKSILIDKYGFKSMEKGINDLKQLYKIWQQWTLF